MFLETVIVPLQRSCNFWSRWCWAWINIVTSDVQDFNEKLELPPRRTKRLAGYEHPQGLTSSSPTALLHHFNLIDGLVVRANAKSGTH